MKVFPQSDKQAALLCSLQRSLTRAYGTINPRTTKITESIGEYGRGDATPSWLLNGYSLQLYSEYTLTLKIGVCVVTAEALGVLAHITAFRARLGRRDQPGERALLATDGSL